jgi:hypothetical protein
MGTVEPIYNDIKHPIEGSGVIEDDTIAFIYGAIKKYGAYKELVPELKEYIKNQVKNIGK